MKCYCKKKIGNNKSAIITKNEVISINPLNYKAHEKADATDVLIDYKIRLLNLTLSIPLCKYLWISDKDRSYFASPNVHIRYGQIQSPI